MPLRAALAVGPSSAGCHSISLSCSSYGEHQEITTRVNITYQCGVIAALQTLSSNWTMNTKVLIHVWTHIQRHTYTLLFLWGSDSSTAPMCMLKAQKRKQVYFFLLVMPNNDCWSARKVQHDTLEDHKALVSSKAHLPLMLS